MYPRLRDGPGSRAPGSWEEVLWRQGLRSRDFLVGEGACELLLCGVWVLRSWGPLGEALPPRALRVASLHFPLQGRQQLRALSHTPHGCLRLCGWAWTCLRPGAHASALPSQFKVGIVGGVASFAVQSSVCLFLGNKRHHCLRLPCIALEPRIPSLKTRGPRSSREKIRYVSCPPLCTGSTWDIVLGVGGKASQGRPWQSHTCGFSAPPWAPSSLQVRSPEFPGCGLLWGLGNNFPARANVERMDLYPCRVGYGHAAGVRIHHQGAGSWKAIWKETHDDLGFHRGCEKLPTTTGLKRPDFFPVPAIRILE